MVNRFWRSFPMLFLSTMFVLLGVYTVPTFRGYLHCSLPFSLRDADRYGCVCFTPSLYHFLSAIDIS